MMASKRYGTCWTLHPKSNGSQCLISLLMRPNIDIDWAIHGRIKDYAEANDINLSEAYTEMLEAGLEALETHGQQ